MARFLFVPVPVAGHVGPALALARGVVSRGHDVTVYAPDRFRAAVERTGASHAPFSRATDYELEKLNEVFPDRPPKAGLAQAIWDMKTLVVDVAEHQLADLETVAEETAPDAVVSDVMAIAGYFIAQKRSLPHAVLNPINLFIPSCDTFPDGFGVAPSSTAWGRLRNRTANWLVNEVALHGLNTHFRRFCDRLGLARPSGSFFELPFRMPQLCMQPTVPSFEYPRSDLPPHVRFIGALLPPPPPDWTEPSWWPDLGHEQKAALVTQGTIATNFDDLLRPALSGLAEEDVLVVATTGNRSVDQLSPGAPNARVEPFVSFEAVMPFVDVMVTNGGYGGIHFALTHGVPLVVAGRSEDKVETTARVAWAGVGINLETDRPKPEEIRDAVRTVLREPTYRERARAIQRELAEYDGPSRGAELLERLARGAPV